MTDNKKKMADPGIKPLGQAVEKFGSIYALIRETLAKHNVDIIDLVVWLVGAGKAAFISEFLEPLLKRFRETQRVRVINKTTILVNLDADPILPFAGARIVANAKGGWVKVQLRRNGKLYIGEKPLSFYLSEKQKGGVHKGHDLKEELATKAISVFHPNIMDALIDVVPHLIPEDLKVDEQNRMRYTFWWAVVYEDASGHRCVRCCCFRAGQWQRSCGWLDDVFDSRDPAASAS